MRTLLVGDSQMVGLSSYLRPAFAALGDVEVVAVTGASTQALAGRLTNLSGPFELAIVCAGGNDTAATAESGMRALASELRRLTGKIEWFGPSAAEDAATRARHAETRATQARLAHSLGVDWHDSWPLTSPLSSYLAPDHVHYRTDGYRMWATKILEELSSQRAWLWFFAPVALGGIAWAIYKLTRK